MDNLQSMAKWWTSDAPTKTSGTNRDSAPILAGLFDDLTAGCQMDHLIEDVDRRVVLTLEKCLQSATPTYRQTLVNEISEAIATYRDTETVGPLNNLAIFSPLMEGHKPSPFISGLRFYDWLGDVNDWTTASPELLHTALNLMVAAVKLEDTSAVGKSFGLESMVPQTVRLRSWRVSEVIRDNPQRLYDIIDICEESPFIDSDLLVEMLVSPAKALRDGML